MDSPFIPAAALMMALVFIATGLFIQDWARRREYRKQSDPFCQAYQFPDVVWKFHYDYFPAEYKNYKEAVKITRVEYGYTIGEQTQPQRWMMTKNVLRTLTTEEIDKCKEQLAASHFKYGQIVRKKLPFNPFF